MSNKKLFLLNKNIPVMKKVHHKDHGITAITTKHATLEHLETLAIYHPKKIQSI
jgi:hypothetical protein